MSNLQYWMWQTPKRAHEIFSSFCLYIEEWRKSNENQLETTPVQKKTQLQPFRITVQKNLKFLRKLWKNLSYIEQHTVLVLGRQKISIWTSWSFSLPPFIWMKTWIFFTNLNFTCLSHTVSLKICLISLLLKGSVHHISHEGVWIQSADRSVGRLFTVGCSHVHI